MPSSFRVRPATPDDKRPSFDVFIPAVRELSARQGAPWDPDPDEVWNNQTAFLDFLAEHAAEWWVAEEDDSGKVIGYARSLERGGLFELSEFFVHPDSQSAGVGRALLDKAFPAGRGEVRAIIATTDVRAQARYYQAGTIARFPIAGLTGKPGVAAGTPVGNGVEPAPATTDDIADLAALERSVIEFDRGNEFKWLLENREGIPVPARPRDRRLCLPGAAWRHRPHRRHPPRPPAVNPGPHRAPRRRAGDRGGGAGGPDGQRGGHAAPARTSLQDGHLPNLPQLEPAVRAVRPLHGLLATFCPLGSVQPAAHASVAPAVQEGGDMSDWQRNPGAIDDPGMKGGTEPELDPLPPGDSADDTATEQPRANELDMPGPDDPVAWSFIEPGTPITGREGVRIGKVEAMLGTEIEGIFHGIALDPAESGPFRVIPADKVTSLTPSEVRVQVAADEVDALAEYDEAG